MAGGAFNVTRLIAELGLKAVTGEEMEVLGKIQPVMQVGNLADVTPPHVAPTALFGSFAVLGAGLFPTVAIQCLAPGGSFVEWLTMESSTTTVTLRILTADPGPTTVVEPAGQASRDPVVSIARSDPVALILGPRITMQPTTAFFPFASRPMFIPRGAFLTLQGTTITTGNFNWGLSWREVPASEHVPS